MLRLPGLNDHFLTAVSVAASIAGTCELAITAVFTLPSRNGRSNRAIGAFALSSLIRFNELSGLPESSDGSGDYRNRSAFRDHIANVYSGFVPGLPLPFPESDAG